MDEDNEIVTQDFTEHFVKHRGISLTPPTVSELALNHAERRFHIGTKMVVLQELFLPVIEVMEQLLGMLCLTRKVESLKVESLRWGAEGLPCSRLIGDKGGCGFLAKRPAAECIVGKPEVGQRWA